MFCKTVFDFQIIVKRIMEALMGLFKEAAYLKFLRMQCM